MHQKPKTLTAEDIYRIYHRETNFAGNGIRVRAVKNFDKAKAKSTWVEFEKFAAKHNRLSGAINAIAFITLLATKAGGYFHPKQLNSQKSIQLYKSEIRIEESTETILSAVTRSLKFIKATGMTWDEYLNAGLYGIPRLMRDKIAGNVSPYLFYMTPNIMGFIKGNYPPDTFAEFGKKIEDEYDEYLEKIEADQDPKLKKIYVNFNRIVDSF